MPFPPSAILLLLIFLMPGLHKAPALAQQPTPIADPAPRSEETGDISLSNPLGDQRQMADRIIVFQGPAAWDSASTRTLVRIENDGMGRLLLDDQRPKAFPRRGSWTSPEIEAEFPFTEVLPSWNLDTPENTGATFEVRVRRASTGEWSSFVYMGQWGRTLHWPARTLDTGFGKVQVDILKLDEPADALQVRARLFSYTLGERIMPALRKLTVVYSGRIDDEEEWARLMPAPLVTGARGRIHPVPFVAQGTNPEEIGGSTCSPTSVRMVMAMQGAELPLTEVALAIWDPEYGIFGNWNRAVAFAGSHGFDAKLVRIRRWEQVEQYIADGQPIIASIRFREGEFPENVLKSTRGHLVVVRGMTPEGDLVMNDPASRDRGEGIIYTRASMQNAWLDKGGVAYIISPPSKRQ